jgi:hypothetical protein
MGWRAPAGRECDEAPMRLMLMAGIVLVTAGSSAFAGGDEYDAAKDVENLGPAYFGFVRDGRGSPISDAQVMLQPNGGEAITIKTNVLGLYRSHIRKDVVPDDVSVSCTKQGFKQERVYRRTPPGSKDMFIETDCTLQKL